MPTQLMLTELYPIDANEDDYLYVKSSTIPFAGLGLFTAITIYRGEIIATFNGEILNENEAKRRVQEKVDDYFMNLPNGLTLDCKNIAGFAKMANDNVNTDFKQNALITMDRNNVVLIAIRTIRVNEEIFTSYGKKYWESK